MASLATYFSVLAWSRRDRTIGVILDPQGGVGALHKAHHIGEFFLDLGLGAEDVGVVQRHGAHPAQSANDPRFLVAVHRSQFGDADRQIAVAVPFRRIDENVVRAVHGTKNEVFVFQLHEREHVVLVMRPVAGGLVQLLLGQVRRIDVLVPVAAFFLGNVGLEFAADGSALGQPQRQPGADEFIAGEQLQLAAKATMVPLTSLLQAPQVIVEAGLVFEYRAVDAGEHGVALVTPASTPRRCA